MQLIERKRGNYKSMLFRADLSSRGKTSDDVEDIFFVIKRQETDTDADAIMTKTMLLDNVTIDANGQVVVPWGADEYEGFTIGETYKLAVFLKFTGDPVADEDVKETFSIKILQDFLHDS